MKDNWKATVKSLQASNIASYGTNELFKLLDKDGKFTQSVGGQATEGFVTGIATGGILSGLGFDIGGAAGLGEFGISTAVGQVASDEVSKSVYSGLRNEGMNNTMASGISGAAGGATFAGTAGLTTLGIQKGTQLARTAMSSLEKSDEAEEGVEMGELGEGAEATGEGLEIGGEVIEGLELGGGVGAERIVCKWKYLTYLIYLRI